MVGRLAGWLVSAKSECKVESIHKPHVVKDLRPPIAHFYFSSLYFLCFTDKALEADQYSVGYHLCLWPKENIIGSNYHGIYKQFQ